jgi:hypothetical protein
MTDQSKSLRKGQMNFSSDQLDKMNRVMGQVGDMRSLKDQREFDRFLMEQPT